MSTHVCNVWNVWGDWGAGWPFIPIYSNISNIANILNILCPAGHVNTCWKSPACLEWLSRLRHDPGRAWLALKPSLFKYSKHSLPHELFQQMFKMVEKMKKWSGGYLADPQSPSFQRFPTLHTFPRFFTPLAISAYVCIVWIAWE